MKKLTYSLIMLATIVISVSVFFTSCNNKNNSVKPVKSNIKIIDKENVPDITPDIFTKLGFVTFNIDITRNVVLDFNKSRLIIPYNKIKSAFNKTENRIKNVGVGICIKIATRKSNCSRGIGFRCGFIRNCQPQKQKSLSTELSRDRIQPVELSLDKTDGELILQFINNVDWKYLENN